MTFDRSESGTSFFCVHLNLDRLTFVFTSHTFAFSGRSRWRTSLPLPSPFPTHLRTSRIHIRTLTSPLTITHFTTPSVVITTTILIKVTQRRQRIRCWHVSCQPLSWHYSRHPWIQSIWKWFLECDCCSCLSIVDINCWRTRCCWWWCSIWPTG